jgi:hypothetical protein
MYMSPITETEDATRTNARKDSEEPNVTKSNTASVDPNFATPTTDIDEANRQKFRSDNELPN